MKIQHYLGNHLRRHAFTKAGRIDAYQPHSRFITLRTPKFESHPRPSPKLCLRTFVHILRLIHPVIIPNVVRRVTVLFASGLIRRTTSTMSPRIWYALSMRKS